jgi:hypothetical protein
LLVTAAKPYAESGTKVTIETWELMKSAEPEFINRVTLQIARGEKPTFEVSGREAEPIKVTVANFGVVSVKFCKSGSVVRGFGEIKRFMGRV